MSVSCDSPSTELTMLSHVSTTLGAFTDAVCDRRTESCFRLGNHHVDFHELLNASMLRERRNSDHAQYGAILFNPTRDAVVANVQRALQDFPHVIGRAAVPKHPRYTPIAIAVQQASVTPIAPPVVRKRRLEGGDLLRHRQLDAGLVLDLLHAHTLRNLGEHQACSVKRGPKQSARPC